MMRKYAVNLYCTLLGRGLEKLFKHKHILKALFLLLLAAQNVIGAPALKDLLQRSSLPPPNFANVKYGEHPRNVLDLWQAKSEKPTPLLVYIHGGGWRGGDKSTIPPGTLKFMLDHGVSVAA